MHLHTYNPHTFPHTSMLHTPHPHPPPHTPTPTYLTWSPHVVMMGMLISSPNSHLLASRYTIGSTYHKLIGRTYLVPNIHMHLTWSPHSLMIGMLMSSTNTVIFLPAGGPYVVPTKYLPKKVVTT